MRYPQRLVLPGEHLVRHSLGSRPPPLLEPAPYAHQAEPRRVRPACSGGGPARSRMRSSGAASRSHRRSGRRTMFKRAALVAVLLGSFLGSAVLLSKDQSPLVSVATQEWLDPVTTGSVKPAGRQPSNTFSGGAEDATEDLP
jgi:hypothetical protein